MSVLEVRNVWKTYDDAVVLERVNATVKDGEFITIVGTSGCGKTTFLQMLLGIQQPSRGAIVLDGAPLVPEPNADRGIVFQRYSVFPHLTVLQNLVIAREFASAPLLARLFGRRYREALAEARAMLDLIGLGAAHARFPHELSGGMQQRLALAQALMKRPKILLLDEPFGALDVGIRADMHKLILNIWQRTQVNIFMVTHDLKEGFYLGTRMWVFDKRRHDPHAPNAYGATITYDIPVHRGERALLREIDRNLHRAERKGGDRALRAEAL